MTRTVAVTNQKGGVGKTTTVASLGVALAAADQRVLLVDLDPQACLTFSLGYDPEDIEISVYPALIGRAELKEIVMAVDDRLDLVPATIELSTAQSEPFVRTGHESALRHVLKGFGNNYDWVFFDCPPSLGVLTLNAFVAAREVLVPLQCETLSHRGLGQLLDTIYDVRRSLNPRLTILGVLPTLFDARTRHSRAVLADVATTYGVPVLQPPIPRSIRFAEAPALGRTVLDTARSSPGANAYRELARGLLDGSAISR